MLKNVLLASATLLAVVGVGAVTANAATYVDYDAGNAVVANNQGDTQATFTGITNTDDTVVNPNASGNGSTAGDATNTTDNNGKRVGGLELTDVPSFNFNKIDGSQTWNLGVRSMTTDGSYGLDGTKAKSTSATAAGAVDGAIVVNDLRGGNLGYSVYAAASSLYTGDGTTTAYHQLPVSDLKLNVADGVANTSTNGQLLGTSGDVDIYHKTSLTFDPSKVATIGGPTLATTPTTQNAKDRRTDSTITPTTDLFGKVAGYGVKVASATANANGAYATGATKATLDLASDDVKASTYSGVITYTLQSSALN